MSTIVMNTRTGAVSEHSLGLQSLSNNFGAGDDGLFALGGDLDGPPLARAQIASEAVTGTMLWDSTQKMLMSDAYLAMTGAGHGVFSVIGRGVQYPYRFDVLPSGVSRALLGRGIKQNYVAFKYQNVAGADFTIDRIEVRSFKSQRRV